MTNLSKRVEKAKLLRITKTNGHFNTWGSKGGPYRIHLASDEKEIITPDGYITIKVFRTNCQSVILNLTKTDATLCGCKGNVNHTVCYHALGTIWKSFKDVGKEVSFYSSYRDADRALTLGGFLAKIVNNNSYGIIWCIVRKATGTPEIRKVSLLPRENNIALMRGLKEDEGID